MRKRTQARDCALKILYQSDIIGKTRPVDLVMDQFWKEENVEDREIREYARRLALGVHEHRDEIDVIITKYATNWQLKRMAVIDKNIMRMSVFELKFATDIPPKVSINEAVDLAKIYGDFESSKFVNGILDKIYKTEIEVSGPLRD